MVIVWIVLAIGLVAFEIHHLAFYAMFGAIGAAAGAIMAAASPEAVGAQLGVALVATTASTVLVRPILRQAYERRRVTGPVARGVHGGLVGHHGVTLDRVGDANQLGHVRLAGERWLAATVGDDVIDPGQPVVVVEIKGTTLTVIATAELQTQ